MKKFIAILTVLTLIFSLAACGKSDKKKAVTYEKENNPVILEDKTMMKEFKDDKGNIISTLEYTYPVVGGELNPAVADNINRYFTGVVEHEAEMAEINMKYTKDYKERFNINSPIATKISYEIYYQDSELLTLVFSRKEGSDADSAVPVEEGCSFSLNDGHRFSVKDLYINGEENDKEALMNAIFKVADKTYSPNGYEVGETVRGRIRDEFDDMNICITADTISFLFSLNVLSGDSRTGTYYCDVKLKDVNKILADPSTFSF